MFEHVGLYVRDFERSKRFYEKTLQVLGYRLLTRTDDEFAGFGADKPVFWIGAVDDAATRDAHVAFVANSREAVDTWYQTALDAGAKDNGKPGLRTEYASNYYAAFVLDPDGNNIEAVCWLEGRAR